jgi:valyl-tRNA synthetase
MSMMEFQDRYDHKTREKYWQQYWEESGIYQWDDKASRADTYVIDTPPPTISGLLHMGHIFSYTHADFIARYQRMKGKTVFYPMGFDDNGLPTERLVEKTRKKRAVDYDSREAFIAVCTEVSEEARAEFRALFKTTALSVDWRQEYHTISEQSRRISQASFLDLYREGQVKRELKPMFWDPVDQTAIAQAEVEDKELAGTFNDIRFRVYKEPSPHGRGQGEGNNQGADSFIIGTTRPEMLPACVAIFYHPDDARYQHLAGKFAVTPLFGVKVPILADDTVEPDKGTGIMMCCTFGDEADIEKWKKHNLPTRIILNKYGKLHFEKGLNDNFILIDDYESSQHRIGMSGGVYPKEATNYIEQLQGKKVTVAREEILKMLAESGDLVASKPITHAVKCAERSGAPLEILPTEQWFVSVLEHKQALKALSKQCNWNPAWMQTRMEQWIDGLSWDWCISRQRYYGVPFPVWYSRRAGEEGKILLAAPHQLPVNPLSDLPQGYTRDEVIADADVMDTWATSSISPQLNAGGIDQDAVRFQQLFPADLRPQAHEIIRSWAFYTLLKSHLHHDCAPWQNLMISGWCLASDKTKMSKSKGNVVTPQGLIEEQSTDAVRYWASTAKLGADTAFSEDQLKIGRKLVTKLWNASKFAAMQLAHLKATPKTATQDVDAGIITHTLDKWMISRVHHAIIASDAAFASYEYSNARIAAEDVFWNDFCDNYLELVKSRAYGNMGEEAQQSACHTIYHVLKALLTLFAPFVPHITEEIFSVMYSDAGSVHQRGSFPHAHDFPRDTDAELIGVHTVAALELVRKAKSERNVSIKYPIDHAYLQGVALTGAEEDFKSASAIALLSDSEIAHDVTLKDATHHFSVSVKFGTQSDAA